jgi:hypothetical protein
LFSYNKLSSSLVGSLQPLPKSAQAFIASLHIIESGKSFCATSRVPILIGVPIILAGSLLSETLVDDSLVDESLGDEQDTNKTAIRKAFNIILLFDFILNKFEFEFEFKSNYKK